MAYSVRRKKAHFDTTQRASVGTSYDTAKSHSFAIEASANELSVNGTTLYYQYAELGSLHVNLSSISGATELTVRICKDSSGDQAVVAEGTGTIMAGLTTATTGAVSIHGLDYPLVPLFNAEGDPLYVFFKTDAGTVTVDNSILTIVS